jgi:hypothetical protein
MNLSREIGVIDASPEFLRVLNVSCEPAGWHWTGFY